MFKGMVSCLATAFLSDVGSAEGEGDGAAPDDDDDEVTVSRGGMFSTEPVASSGDELPPPKNSFNFPGARLMDCLSCSKIFRTHQ
jgi:hypothetical protein